MAVEKVHAYATPPTSHNKKKKNNEGEWARWGYSFRSGQSVQQYRLLHAERKGKKIKERMNIRKPAARVNILHCSHSRETYRCGLRRPLTPQGVEVNATDFHDITTSECAWIVFDVDVLTCMNSRLNGCFPKEMTQGTFPLQAGTLGICQCSNARFLPPQRID